MKLKILNLSLLLFIVFLLKGQTSTLQSKSFKLKKLKTTSEVDSKPDFQAQLRSVEAPSPDGDSYKSFLMQQKIKSKARFPYKTSQNIKSSLESDVPSPLILNGFAMTERTFSDEPSPSYGGRPIDNTSAISNDGLLLLAINAKVYLHDTKTDSILYPNDILSLRQVFDLPNDRYFDPKIMYDKDTDRFILLFLKDSSPATSEIIVGFSRTNNPIDGWNVYTLPGNPLDNNRWTDFPVISITDKYLYITINLIVPDVSWQVGFDRSVLWEIDKMTAYEGLNDIEPTLYSDFTFENKFVRNLHCIQGADGSSDQLHLLSNRNFDIANDTLFLARLNKDSNNVASIDVRALVSDIPYGVPPNGRQADTDTTDPTKGLQTNDARVLGAIQFEDEIQFVSSSINPNTGFSSIYHGIVHDLYTNPRITANLISDEVKDFAYPNIAWTGNEACDRETMIAFNHSSFVDNPGISVVYYNNEARYSEVLELKKGDAILDRFNNDSYERWGDYFGMQRKYNEPGKIFTFGFTTDETRNNYGWVNELFTPDTSTINFTYEINSPENLCEKNVLIQASGGIGPYRVEWENSALQGLVSPNYCNGDTSNFTVYDSRGCSKSGQVIFEIEDHNNNFSLFPNPTTDYIAFQFRAEEKIKVEVNILDAKGAFVNQIIYQDVDAGLIELMFSTKPLPRGTYFVDILGDNKRLSRNKFVKN